MLSQSFQAPRIAISYEGNDRPYLDRLLPLVDVIEVVPDGLPRVKGETITLAPAALDELEEVSDRVKIGIHGVGLSLGSHEGIYEPYLQSLDQLIERVPIEYHSEHLGYVRVDGQHLGTMLTLPHTNEALDMVCKRIERLQTRFGLPFLIENVARILPDYPGEYSDAGFLNAITARTGCGLLLDVYNLQCDQTNLGLDVDAFLDELNLAAVWEIHLARGVEHKGFLLDIHSRILHEDSIELAQRVVQKAAGTVQTVTYEVLRQAVGVLGHDAIAGELVRLRQAVSG